MSAQERHYVVRLLRGMTTDEVQRNGKSCSRVTPGRRNRAALSSDLNFSGVVTFSYG